jgi:hypothetical protein
MPHRYPASHVMALRAVAQVPARLLQPCPSGFSPNPATDSPVSVQAHVFTSELLLTASRLPGRQAAETEKALWPATTSPPTGRRHATTCRHGPLANPNVCVLIYDTPVPGHVAPPATIGPAARVSFRLLPPEGKGLIMADGEVPGRMPFRLYGPAAPDGLAA